jgi:sugar phosphate isomerase/epimerase
MKFSMMTYTMARQGFQVEDIVRVAAELKMDGIDWVSTYGRDPRELKKRSDDAGLPVVAHTFFLSKVTTREPGYLDDAKKSLEDAVILGAPLVMIPTPPVAGVADRRECRKIWTDALTQIAPLATDAGVLLTVENFPGLSSPFVTAADFFEAREAVPSLYLTFDNGNASTGEDQLESLRQCISYVKHVHFKDWDFSPDPLEGYRQMINGYYRPALIGEGDIDSLATLRELKKNGYAGYINIEYENNDHPADRAMAKVLAYLQKSL